LKKQKEQHRLKIFKRLFSVALLSNLIQKSPKTRRGITQTK